MIQHGPDDLAGRRGLLIAGPEDPRLEFGALRDRARAGVQRDGGQHGVHERAEAGARGVITADADVDHFHLDRREIRRLCRGRAGPLRDGLDDEARPRAAFEGCLPGGLPLVVPLAVGLHDAAADLLQQVITA